ncbi:hypothetical protein L249_0798 [Ophiocordyceps polyrhachis-furcata BCC 54312]|uniref:Uncharacterized protein n=1 Tax=Ophiocordyceps polyrhachis-furcata BCC 54312 TaxID=1330021 RepID=A0A367LFZ7_9HYPO|nr:hypothetical protein L249_0798 [Ophiocordyceps polyrhachis-furcata BCC 54312]
MSSSYPPPAPPPHHHPILTNRNHLLFPLLFLFLLLLLPLPFTLLVTNTMAPSSVPDSLPLSRPIPQKRRETERNGRSPTTPPLVFVLGVCLSFCFFLSCRYRFSTGELSSLIDSPFALIHPNVS